MPIRFYSKICGLTRIEDARLAKSLGADFLGMVFHPASERMCTIDVALEIRQSFPDSPRVLVFGYDEKEYIFEIYKKLRDLMSFVQVPSDHPDFKEICEVLTKPKVFPVIYPTKKLLEQDVDSFREHSIILFDTPKVQNGVKLAGGSGEPFPWEFVKEIQRPYLLAGGLNPENLCNALQALEPFGVDVSSGIELSPGIKDESKLRKFYHILNGYPENCP
ncbi:MAG: phosphoribosylanthranilate isomerase [Candidatus Hydrogenedentota bacterium]|nr:MAG: phosphoribosylanthranilate isomerase [Candidatus Hydrogenedentota bacterium]